MSCLFCIKSNVVVANTWWSCQFYITSNNIMVGDLHCSVLLRSLHMLLNFLYLHYQAAPHDTLTSCRPDLRLWLAVEHRIISTRFVLAECVGGAPEITWSIENNFNHFWHKLMKAMLACFFVSKFFLFTFGAILMDYVPFGAPPTYSAMTHSRALTHCFAVYHWWMWSEITWSIKNCSKCK